MVRDDMVGDDMVGESAPHERNADDHEAAALLGVQQRLLARFPDLGPAAIHRVVVAAHARLTGPIRDFVPLLVEHSARDILQGLVTHPEAA